MLLLRVVAIIAVMAIGASVLAWMFSGDKRYLVIAWRIAKGAIFVGLAVMALLAAERLIVL